MIRSHRFDVIGLGCAAIDYLAVVPYMPEIDTKLLMEDFSIQGGGPAATAVATVARLGARAAFVGQVGDDDFSSFIISELTRECVDVSRVIKRPNSMSQFSFILVDKSTGKRTIIWTRSDIPSLCPSVLDKNFIASCKVLHLDRHEIEAGIQAAKWVHDAGGIVSMDAGTYKPEVLDLLPHVDVLITSHVFARDATGESDPMNAARALLDKRRIVGVTCGESGSYFAARNEEFHVPAFKVEVVDTTGAGDVFHGAFAFGLSRDWDSRHCAVFSSAVAAMKCTKLGGRAGIPTLGQVEAFLAKNGTR